MAHLYTTENGKWRVLIEKRVVRKSSTWATEREATAWAKRVEADEIELDVKLTEVDIAAWRDEPRH